jgi:hypothetical protein
MKLQMFIQGVTSELEKTTTQVVEDMPKVIKQVDIVQQEVVSLKERMGVVKRDIEKVEQDTAQSMSLLVQLDELKTRLVDTTGALQEADNWTTLSDDTDAAFEAEDLKTVASKLLGMQRSLLVLSDSADFEERNARLSLLQAKFERLVVPRLEQAFSSHNLELAKESVVMLKDVNKESQVVECFVRAHSARLLVEWATLSNDSKLKLEDVLVTYYSSVVRLVVQEKEWCVDVFEDDSCVRQLLGKVLSGRAPSLSDAIRGELGRSDEQLKCIVALFKQTERFAAYLEMPDDPAVNDAIFAAFKPFQLDFARLLRTDMKSLRPFAAPSVAATVNEVVAAVQQSVPAFFEMMFVGVTMCDSFTKGLALPGLVGALDDFAGAYYDALKAVCCARLVGTRGGLCARGC